MPNFSYVGRTRSGKAMEGEIFADTKDGAIEQLRKQSILVTNVKEKKEGGGLFGDKKVTSKDVAVFTRQMCFMIDAGLPINQALEILGAQTESKTLQKALFLIRQDIEGGSSFSDSLAKHPAIFSDLYVNMIAAGESGGILDIILDRLAIFIEKIVKLTRAVKSALVYPISVMIIAVVAVAVILWKVIPTFAELFMGLGAELPMPTKVTIAISEFLGSYMIFIVGGIIALVSTVKWYATTDSGKRHIDALLLRLPVMGDILEKIAIARFCRTLGTLVSSGVPILEGLEITAKTAGNSIVEDEIMEARASVESGKTLSEPLQESDIFPTMVVQMVNVGEQTGELDAMLSKVADFYEEEVDAAVADLMALMEPMIILFLGGSIGWIVVSMYMPIFSLISEIM
jgi:type IV pilus assembly protein PilC